MDHESEPTYHINSFGKLNEMPSQTDAKNHDSSNTTKTPGIPVIRDTPGVGQTVPTGHPSSPELTTVGNRIPVERKILST